LIALFNKTLDLKYINDYLDKEPVIGGLLDVLVIISCVFGVGYLIVKITNKYKVHDRGIYLLLWLYHLLFTIAYYIKGKSGAGTMDSRMYYMKGVNSNAYYPMDIKFSLGSDFLFWTSDFIHRVFNLNYLAVNVVFSSLGFIGLLLFLDVCYSVGYRKNMKYLGVYLLPTLLFFPNIHIWTCQFSKDSVVFFAIMMVIYSLSKVKTSLLLFLLGSFIVFMIRPHVYIMLGIALGTTIFIWGNQSIYLKLPILIVLSIVGYFAVTFFISKFFGILSFDIEAILNVLDSRRGYYVGKNYSGSSIDTSSYPYPLKVFSYLYRPIFEKPNLNYFIMGIDNVFALFVASALWSKRFFYWLKRSPFIVKFCLVFVLVEVSFFANIFSNFGIAVRQKTMFIYALYIVIFGFIAYMYDLRESKRSTVIL